MTTALVNEWKAEPSRTIDTTTKKESENDTNNIMLKNQDKIQANRVANKDKAKDYNRTIKAQRKNTENNNTENIQEQQRRFYETNKEECNNKNREYYKKRMKYWLKIRHTEKETGSRFWQPTNQNTHVSGGLY